MTISFRNCQRKAKAKEEADPCGMTVRKAKARANTWVSPLRCAPVEMTLA
jgi:hypothetical protein